MTILSPIAPPAGLIEVTDSTEDTWRKNDDGTWTCVAPYLSDSERSQYTNWPWSRLVAFYGTSGLTATLWEPILGDEWDGCVIPEVEHTQRADVLQEAERLITGDRNKSYGSPVQNFTNIADLLTIQFGHKLREGERFTATDVSAAMIHVKLARLIAQPKRDNFVDIAGYAACGWECEASAMDDTPENE